MGFPACCHADEGGMIKTPNTSLFGTSCYHELLVLGLKQNHSLKFY